MQRLSLYGALIMVLTALITACSSSADEQPTPEPTAIPRPTVVVITAAGPYSTAFEDTGDWLVGESDSGGGRIEDGRYILGVDEAFTLGWSHQQRAFGDAIYEIEANLERGSEASGFGFLLLGSSDMSSFMYAMITGDGRFDIGYCADSCATQESLIGGYTLAPTILVNNQVNYLRVELSQGSLTFSVNGAAVSQINDLEYEKGLLGLIAESARFGGMEAAFDNLRVTEK